jgi:hypothetical protein
MADRVSILVVAGLHSLFGELENRSLRVLDVLNDVSTSFLQLQDVTVMRGFHGERVKRIQDAMIPKAAIDFVLLESDTHEAPMRRRHSFVEKRAQRALVLMTDFEIRGTFMLKGSADSSMGALGKDSSAFFPMTTANVKRLVSTGESVKAGVVMINKAKVSLLHLEQEQAPAYDLGSAPDESKGEAQAAQ